MPTRARDGVEWIFRVSRPRFTAYLERLRCLARVARADERSRDQFIEAPNRDFEGYGFADGWKYTLGVLFDEGSGSRP